MFKQLNATWISLHHIADKYIEIEFFQTLEVSPIGTSLYIQMFPASERGFTKLCKNSYL